jgi:hypothetical protein
MLIQSGIDEYLLEPTPIGPEDKMPWVYDYKMTDHDLLHKESSTVEDILSLFPPRERSQQIDRIKLVGRYTAPAKRGTSCERRFGYKTHEAFLYVKRQNKPRESSRPTIHSS